MATIAVARVCVTLKIDDKEYQIHEGDVINNLRYKVGKDEKEITGAVRVISASTTAQNVDPHTTCPPDPYLSNYIKMTGMIIDSSTDKEAVLTRITLGNIVGLDSVTPQEETDGSTVIGTGPQYKKLDEVIAAAESGAVIKLAAGEYEAPLTIDKDITIIGNAPGVVLTGKITAAAPTAAPATRIVSMDPAANEQVGEPTTKIKVHIENVKLTGDALISVGKGVEEFTMIDCTFGGHNMDSSVKKVMPINFTGDEPILLTVKNNVFEDEPGNAYNLFEVLAYLKDGSVFSGNEFSAKCCCHNAISLYGIVDNAEIHICNNHAVYSANMVRIGFRGTPVGKVIMDGNSYDTTDPDARYAGLFLVQPYATKTTSFAGTEIFLTNTDAPDGNQICYIYSGKTDTPWTDTNKPIIYYNGNKIDIPNANLNT